MSQYFQNLKFSILIPFVLIYFFDSHGVTSGDASAGLPGSVDDAERAVANYFFGCVGLYGVFGEGFFHLGVKDVVFDILLNAVRRHFPILFQNLLFPKFFQLHFSNYFIPLII